jgi:hypothetical protein
MCAEFNLPHYDRGFKHRSDRTWAYPELFALVGGNVPDYRGLFLRGHGSQIGYSSEGIGVIQIDQMRPITGSGHAVEPIGDMSGAMYSGGAVYYYGVNPEWDHINVLLKFDSSRLGTHYNGSDTHPVNTAVSYLIRALP